MLFRLSILAVASLMALPASAQDFTGRWRTTEPVGEGEGSTTIVFNFEADGNNLTGTITMGPLLGLAIEDGMVDGARISFRQTIVGRGGGSGTLTLVYEGTMEGELIRFMRRPATDVERGGGRGFSVADPVEFAAERID
jgi:hypothetical protein